ncbi:VWA domain-containing protein [Labedella endophytica]|uniref:VWA domain-containing protein n=1 Tax=Labedella endophytica TaxID=1523160 RepID=A0A433JS72_9MICO|nr:VWA domain-containing protein [Labedella endophytica]RUR01141.1 VWA domain-containing protein [Labedella endophytica]
MILDPVLPVWFLVVVAGALAVFAIVQLVSPGSGRSRWMWLSRLVMVLLLAVIALRPALPAPTLPPAASGDVDVYFVVDTTSSMAAEDWGDGEPRLDGVREDVLAIAERLIGARVSLVTFDAVTVHRVPLTTDVSALAQATRALEQEITTYSAGSSIDEPVEYLTGILTEDAAENPERSRILYYLGDGEQTSGREPGTFAELSAAVDGGAVLGYGTEAGGPMKQYTGYDDGTEQSYIQDYSTGTDAISRIDEQALGTIAEQLGLPYIHRDADTSVAEATDGVRVGDVESAGEVPAAQGELYWIAAIPLAALALVELAWMLAAVLRSGVVGRSGAGRRDGRRASHG